MTLPRILVTQGDVAGIGPEIIVKAWPQLVKLVRPVVIGDPQWLNRAIPPDARIRVESVDGLDFDRAAKYVIPVRNPSSAKLDQVRVGAVSAEAGRAAHDFLIDAVDHTSAGHADAIVTCPLHKEGLYRAGITHPGHTEILAERTGTKQFAMVLWGDGIAVAHVTLHMSLRSVFDHLSTDGILEKIRLLHGLLPRLIDRPARIGVAALNPHGGDGGLFGDEEARLIRPAVEQALRDGIDVSGPWPADTLFVRAHRGEFDGIAAMYHDEGHIAMKLRCGPRCVNITVGLPIIRTSVAHGTAYDIAGKNQADPGSLVAAADVAARLARNRGVG